MKPFPSMARDAFVDEVLDALKDWHEAAKIWDDVPGEKLEDITLPSEAEQHRCNEAGKKLRALAELVR